MIKLTQNNFEDHGQPYEVKTSYNNGQIPRCKYFSTLIEAFDSVSDCILEHAADDVIITDRKNKKIVYTRWKR